MRIYIDSETIPSQDPTVKAEIAAQFVVSDDIGPIKAGGRLAKPEKAKTDEDRAARQADIDADIAKKTAEAKAALAVKKTKAADDAEKAYRDLAFNGASAHIACISFAIDDGDVVNVPCISAPDGVPNVENERYALRHFFDLLESATFPAHAESGGLADDTWLADARVGAESEAIRVLKPGNWSLLYPIIVAHNAQFDVRTIWQRAVILGVTPPSWWPIDARPWDRSRIIDTMTMWAGERDRIKLDALCKALGLPGKGSIDGSKVYDAILAGRLPEVVNYCGDDVRRLRCVHRRMTGLPPLAADIAALTPAVATEAA